MKFFVSRDIYGGLSLSNFCPYSRETRYKDFIGREMCYYYPYFLGGSPWQETISEKDLEEKFRINNLPEGTVINLVTGEIIPYEDLLPIENWEKQIYYEFGID